MQYQTKEFSINFPSEPTKHSNTLMTSPYLKLEQAIKINTKELKEELHHENQNDDEQNFAMDLEDETERMSEIISKLLSKNKVSTKNAFEVPIVDVSHLKYYQSSDEGSWSKISTTLENCSKIYAYRVDCVNENICKMSTSIARNLKQELECKDVTKQKVEAELFKVENYKPINCNNLDLHLDKDKLDKECFIVEVQNANRVKFRRMMDQNGISGLILATVPLSKSLAVELEPFIDSTIKKETVQNFKFEELLPKQECNWKTIEKITKVTANGIIELKEEPENKIEGFLESIDEAKIELNEGQIFSKELEETDYIEPVEDENSVLKTERKVINFGKNKRNEVKRSDIKSKNNEISRSAANESTCCFDFNETLEKESILKMDENSIKKQLNVKESVKSNLVNFVSPYQITRMKKMFATSITEEPIIQNLGFNHQIQSENLHGDYSNNYSNQNIEKESMGMKFPSVKETKIELNNLLLGMNEILFSELFNFHRERIGNPYETIDFLSVLHLSNEQGLLLKEVNDYDFMISKPIA